MRLEGLEERWLPSGLTGTPGKDGTPGAPLAGVVNTYYAGAANVSAGATSISLGAARGSATTITPGDLLLVVQVQNASFNSSNNATYGDGGGSGSGATGTTAGTFEYAVANGTLSAAGGTLSVIGAGGGGLVNPYFEASSTATHGQETFEVVRVPQYLNATLGSTLTAASWNGSTGGVLALDVAGNLNLNSATVSVDGEGFRGGAGLQFTGGSGLATDYALASTANDDGSKGEGTAGTPEWVYDVTTNTNVNTGQAFDGLPGGSMARGAPGNAGGGGTDANPAANDQNTGGGGGGNGGAGGQGGYSWATALDLGGIGGAAFPASFSQLTLGGGGGAGARNNSSSTASAGGTGGGVILVRAGTVSGTGTVTANGIMGVTPQNDGGPGGGAGGSVEFLVGSGSLAGLSVQARGANGTNAFPAGGHSATPPPSSSSNYHGPGGGGGGGVVALSGPAGSVDVGGGGHGTTTVDQNIYGAVVGNPGIILMPLTDGQIPGAGGGFEATADVSVVASAPSSVLPNGTISYTLTVHNAGPAAAQNVSLADAVPAGTTFVSATQTGGASAFGLTKPSVGGTGTLTGTDATLAVGDTATFLVVVQLNAGTGTGTTVSDTANVSTTSVDPNQANNTSSAQTVVGPDADLAVTNSAPAVVATNGTLTYTITVSNNGPNAAQNVSLSDLLPAGTTFASQSQTSGPAFTLSNTGNQVSDTIAALASGQSATFQVQATVTAAAGTNLSDTATVSSPTLDPNPANNSASAATAVQPSADLAVTLSAPALGTAGANLPYTITVTNKGPDAAQNVVLSDLLPANTTFLSQSQTSGPAFTLANTGNQVSDTLASLASGQSATFQVIAQVSPGLTSATNVSDTATVSAVTPDPNSANNTNSATTAVSLNADLATLKIAPAQVSPGANFTYLITVYNLGQTDAQNVSVTDTLPGSITFVSQAQAGGPAATLSNVGNAITDTIATLPAGQSASFQVVALVPAGTAQGTGIPNTANATSSTPDANPNNNGGAVQSIVGPSPGLAISNVVSNPTPNVGGTITYTVTLTNVGATASNVTVSDPLPTWLSGITTAPAAGTTYSGGVWTIPTLANNGTVTLTITGTVNDPNPHGSTATVTGSSQPFANPDQASAVETPQQADLSLTNVVSNPTPNVGDPVSYTVTLTNNGTNTATNVTVGDALPAWLSGVTTNTSAGTYAGGVWTVPSLAKGGSVTLTFNGTVNDPNAHTSTATVTHSDQFDPTTPDTASATETPRQADLTVTNVVSNPTPNVGDTVTYTVTLTNAGPNAASNVTVSDPLPAGLSNVLTTPAAGTSYAGGVWAVPTLASGGSVTLTFTGTVSDPNAHTSTATVTHSDQFDPTTPDTASATETPQRADLTVTNAVSNNAPFTGHTITYTVTLTNAGPNAASNVTVSDALPTWLSGITTVASAGTYAGGVWTVPSLANGGTVTLTITGTLNDVNTHASTATVTHSDQFDPTTPDTSSVSETSKLDVITSNNQSLSTNENTALPGNVTATDNDGDTLTYAAVANPTHGALTLNPNGSFTYTPANNYHGPDSFTFNATDGGTTSNTATVSINVVDSSVPVGNPQSLST
ncbi:MAG TPA: CARDB domain-containing protein, partial [Gemmataceae bacterium]|nr:CARDB domain-containing protein [Gemmataceae bacterium]